MVVVHDQRAFICVIQEASLPSAFKLPWCVVRLWSCLVVVVEIRQAPIQGSW